MFLKSLFEKKGKPKGCEICNIQFNLIVHIHKCKRCLRYVCYECGKHKDFVITVEVMESQKKQRICDLCKQDMDQISRTISKIGAKWKSSSHFSKEWLSSTKQHEQEYKHFLKLFQQNKKVYAETSQKIEKEVSMGRADPTVYNYSLRDFFYRLVRGYSQEYIRKAITTKYSSIGYWQGMSSIAAFLLCFGSEVEAFQIFGIIIQNIAPVNLYSKSSSGTNSLGMLAEIYFVRQYFIYYMLEIRKKQLNDSQKQTFRTIIQLLASKCFVDLFVNHLAFVNIIFLWKQMLAERSFVVMERALLAIIYLFHENIAAKSSHIKQLDRFMEIMDHAQFKQIYLEIEIDLKIKQELLSKFHTEFSTQWNNKQDQHSLKRLVSIGKFNEEELKIIQDGFLKHIDRTQKKGLTKTQFMNIVKVYDQRVKEKGVVLFDDKFRQMEYFLRVFDNFDEHKTGLMDFREFIWCASVILRGNLKERLASLIQTLGAQYGFIPQQRFSEMLKTLFEVIHKHADFDEELTELQSGFKARINYQYGSLQKISISELYIIINDPFITEVTFRISLNQKPHKQAEHLAQVFGIVAKL